MPKDVRNRFNIKLYIMKNLVYTFMLICPVLFSCGDDNNSVAALSRTEMISKAWVYQEITVHTTTTDSSTTSVTTDLSDHNAELEFFADGTVVYRFNNFSESNIWEFVDDSTVRIRSGDHSEAHEILWDIIKLTTDQLWMAYDTYTEEESTQMFEYKLIPKRSSR